MCQIVKLGECGAEDDAHPGLASESDLLHTPYIVTALSEGAAL